jgi:ribosomal protein L29
MEARVPKRVGRPPHTGERTKSKSTFSVRLTLTQETRIRDLARNNQRSVGEIVERLLDTALEGPLLKRLEASIEHQNQYVIEQIRALVGGQAAELKAQVTELKAQLAELKVQLAAAQSRYEGLLAATRALVARPPHDETPSSFDAAAE